MKKLVFKVTEQKITYDKEAYIVTDSWNYITARFEFSEEWGGLSKTAIFKGANGTYSVLLTDDACIVPHEVLAGGFSVSVYGSSGNMRITADSVYINAVKSGYEDNQTPPDPTPTVYEEILDKFSDIKQADSERAEQVKQNADGIDAIRSDMADMNNTLNTKVDKVQGKGLSSNDYTDEEKAKLASLENYTLPDDVVHDSGYVHTDNNYTTAEKNKLAGLNNYDDTDIKADIAKKADKLKSIPHTKLSGNPITITDALADEQPLELRVYGDGIGDLNNGKYEIPIKNSGKNIVDLANMKWKAATLGNTSYEFNNNTVTIKRTVTSENSCAIYTDISLQAGTYTVSVSNISINGTFADNAPWVYSPAFSTVYKSRGFKKTFTLDGDTTTQIYLYNPATGGTAGLTATFSVQIEMGSAATEYEPYHEPQTATAILDTPLSGSEYIDLVSKKRNGETDITVSGNIELFDGVNKITCQTAAAPSKLEVSYYQDINKVLEELKNAILSQGGNV